MRIGADENGVTAGFGKLEPDRHQQISTSCSGIPKTFAAQARSDESFNLLNHQFLKPQSLLMNH